MRPPSSSSMDGSKSRKQSFAAPIQSRSNVPTTFFLARESELTGRSDPAAPEEPILQSIYTLEEALQEASSRRRSTIKPSNTIRTHDQTQSADPLTSLFTSPADTSLPSSPKSTSTRSLHHAESASISDEITSQALLSSEEEEADVRETPDSAPQLIMPSIRMPSRRPFTEAGRNMGRMKILVAGSRGSGKTSLIKSIVQSCEDIVHVDPFSITPSNSSIPDRSERHTMEIHASTKSYPPWWSEIEESRLLRRRKSLGDVVLERNICFVETQSKSDDSVIQYIEKQLSLAIASTSTNSADFVGMLSGAGGCQVDVILYLVSKVTMSQNIESIRKLSKLSNIVPLIAKSDALSMEEVSQLKRDIKEALTERTTRAFSFPTLDEFDQPPYSISVATSSDIENMDASLLMSSEYVQPLIPSQLSFLIKQIFEKDTMAYLRHSAAKKLLSWRSQNPVPIEIPPPSTSPSPRPSTLGSPVLTSTSVSGVMVPYASDMSINTSNSFTLARLADHTQREERLAQVRLTKWANDLQQSLTRERERYERLARNDRAVWLVEKMGEEVKDGRVQPLQLHRSVGLPSYTQSGFANDPLGLLKWNDDMRTRGWIALQVVGSFGVIGGLALWLSQTWSISWKW